MNSAVYTSTALDRPTEKEQVPNIENTNNESLINLNDCHSLMDQIEQIVSGDGRDCQECGVPQPRQPLGMQAHNIKSLSEGLANRLRTIRDALGN